MTKRGPPPPLVDTRPVARDALGPFPHVPQGSALFSDRTVPWWPSGSEKQARPLYLTLPPGEDGLVPCQD
jgi:hypothetical protein